MARRAGMIPAGYMAKRVATAPEWLDDSRVGDIHSVSGCISAYFADYLNFWEHNGYWLFDSPEAIRRLAVRASVDLSDTNLFYYEVYEYQFQDETGEWESFRPEPSFPLNVEKPRAARLEGYDVVSFIAGTNPECSPLSCNGLANEIETNRRCLLPSLETARDLLDAGQFTNCEPGPYRIFTVHSLDWP